MKKSDSTLALIDKVKILVVGDSGVGKSSAVHLLCHNRPLANASWTIGCNVEVKLHEYREGTASQKTYFVELWDIGGSSSHSSARAVFYNSFHGLILVHDLTNKKSHENLRKWLSEVFCKDCPSKKANGMLEFDQEMFADSQVPILVVATKVDLVPQTAGRALATVADECGTDQVLLDNHNPKTLSPGSSNALKVTRFLDKVVERRFRSGATSPPTSATLPVVDRRRTKLSHLD
ncbi:rab-like protein 3 isoform X1 [Rhipicephalus sanguineus]|uniref:rab-like protein 3 isoform X1 n=1 Tax=Rhipicephalus sanguineus TaxID=34632 RepID=UPI001893564E|nr:rab-like protein 3 isoform X1 [Rhipicephalus sanguineus]